MVAEPPSEDRNRRSFKNVMLYFVEQSMMDKFQTLSYPTDKWTNFLVTVKLMAMFRIPDVVLDSFCISATAISMGFYSATLEPHLRQVMTVHALCFCFHSHTELQGRWDGWDMWHIRGKKEMHTGFWWGSLMERSTSNTDTDARMILTWTENKKYRIGKECNGINWPGIRASVRLLGTRWWSSRLHKMKGNFLTSSRNINLSKGIILHRVGQARSQSVTVSTPSTITMQHVHPPVCLPCSICNIIKCHNALHELQPQPALIIRT